MFTNQFLNCGVSEQNMTTVACGLALEGFRVYTVALKKDCEHIYSDFSVNPKSL